jgi:cell division protein FtsB
VSRRLLGAGVGLLLAAVLGMYGITGLVRVQEMRAEIDLAERELATLRAQQRGLAETIERLRHDPAYIEKLAREEHGLVRPGETVLKFPAKGQ